MDRYSLSNSLCTTQDENQCSRQQGSQLKHLWRGGNLGGLPMVDLLHWWAPLEAVDKFGCEMQFERFYSLNHSIVPWFAHLQQLAGLGFSQEYSQTWANFCGVNGVIVRPYTHPQ